MVETNLPKPHWTRSWQWGFLPQAETRNKFGQVREKRSRVSEYVRIFMIAAATFVAIVEFVLPVATAQTLGDAGLYTTLFVYSIGTVGLFLGAITTNEAYPSVMCMRMLTWEAPFYPRFTQFAFLRPVCQIIMANPATLTAYGTIFLIALWLCNAELRYYVPGMFVGWLTVVYMCNFVKKYTWDVKPIVASIIMTFIVLFLGWLCAHDPDTGRLALIVCGFVVAWTVALVFWREYIGPWLHRVIHRHCLDRATEYDRQIFQLRDMLACRNDQAKVLAEVVALLDADRRRGDYNIGEARRLVERSVLPTLVPEAERLYHLLRAAKEQLAAKEPPPPPPMRSKQRS